jgi:hypothetical protein
MSGTGSSSFSRSAKRYEVQFQDNSQRHSDTNDVEQQGTSHGYSQTGISQHKNMIGLRKKSFSGRVRMPKNEETTRLESVY